jgi:hypothetical protein
MFSPFNKKASAAIGIILITIYSLSSVANGGTITVKVDGTGDYPTIQSAINASSNGDTVIISPGRYTGDGNLNIDFMGKAITVRSIDPNDPCVVDSTIIDCQSNGRGFNFHTAENGNSILAGLSITNGFIDRGAGILCLNSSPTIYRCSIIANTSNALNSSGAGICCDTANPKIIQCKISNNTVSGGNAWGGGIGCIRSSPDINNCVIYNNSASKGGGIYGYMASPTISNCTIVDNTTSFSGGGVEAYQRVLYIDNCIVWGNSAPRGPELYGYFFDETNVSYSNIRGGMPGLGNIDKDPCFVNAAAGNFHISKNSPCVDAGNPDSTAPDERDIDLNRRIINHRIDIGADEVDYNQPFLSFSSNIFCFAAHKDDSSPQHAVLQISNEGSQVLHWQINENYNWLQINPSDGNCIGNTIDVNLYVDASGLQEGIYKGLITVTAQGAVNNPRTITVILSVLADKPNTRIVGLQYSNIQAAINDSVNGDTVLICPGIYKGTGNRNIDFFGRSITVTGLDTNDSEIIAATVIDCQGQGRGFKFHSGENYNSVLSGLTITNGYPSYEKFKLGGSTYMWIVGGAVFCDTASPTLSDCVFTRNTVIGGNDRGAAIYCLRGSPLIRRCRIIENISQTTAGGLRADENSFPTLDNCIFANNKAFTHGGNTISTYQSTPVLRNCTLFDDSSISVDGWYGCRIVITNSIIWSNSVQLSSGCEVTYSDIKAGYAGNGNINADPCFVNYKNYDFHLLSFSPCIDTGDPNYVSEPNETDFDGLPRVIGGRVDMGAYEFNHRPVAVAGPDQTVYAWIDGIAEVELDGSDSNDPDGDELTYKWTWTIDSNTYEANGVNPAIELPVGVHTIQLIVNDGLADSVPDDVNITVIAPLKSSLRITPRIINRCSRQSYILALVRMPDGIMKKDISNEPLILYPGEIEASRQWIVSIPYGFGRNKKWLTEIFAFFDKDAVVDAIPTNGRVELKVAGELTCGRCFYGSDTVTIIGPRRRK